MQNRIEYIRRNSAYLRLFALEWFLFLLVLAFFAGYIFFNLNISRENIRQEEESRLETQTKIVHDSLLSHLLSIQNAHHNIRAEMIDAQITNEDRSPFIRKRLRGFVESIPSAWTMMVVDKEGKVWQSSHLEVVGRDLSNRGFYLKSKQAENLNQLIISKPYSTVSGYWTVSVVTIIPDLNNNFNGVVVTQLEPRNIMALLSSVLFSKDMQAAVGFGDGQVFIETRENNEETRNMQDLYIAKHVASQKQQSVFVRDDKKANEQRLIAIRTLVPSDDSNLKFDELLLVGVSRDMNHIYQNWNHSRLLNLWLFLAMFISSTLGLAMLQRRRYTAYLERQAAATALLEKNLQLQELNSELQAYSSHLSEIAFLDGLTNVANRRHFDKMFRSEWSRALREQQSLSLLMIDLDFFKDFNDFYGHQKGDDCLRSVAAAMKDTLARSSDLLARYGGEEFVCLLPNTKTTGAVKLATKICEKVAELAIPHEKSSVSQVVSVSIGVASVIPSDEMYQEDLLQAADNALYKAKQAGRNRFCTNQE